MASDAATIPITGRAWVRRSRGHYASSLQLVDALPSPEKPGAESADVVIRVSHVALEFAIAIVLGIFPALPFAPPMVPELEYSGVVIAAGGRVPEDLRKAGTRVLGCVTPADMLLRGAGVLREYIRVPPTLVAPLPEAGPKDRTMGMSEAAGLVGSGSTALAMVKAANVKPGHRVLVNGASGSVGHMVTQLCHIRGAFVVGVASGRNEESVRNCGASEFIDYTKHSLAEYLSSTYNSEPFDYILDCVGSQDLYVKSPNYLKPAGALINVGALASGIFSQLTYWIMNTWRPTWLGGVPRRYVMFSTPTTKDYFDTLFPLFQSGKLKVLLDSEWAMEDAIKAYDRMSTKRARGKVIIKVSDC